MVINTFSVVVWLAMLGIAIFLLYKLFSPFIAVICARYRKISITPDLIDRTAKSFRAIHLIVLFSAIVLFSSSWLAHTSINPLPLFEVIKAIDYTTVDNPASINPLFGVILENRTHATSNKPKYQLILLEYTDLQNFMNNNPEYTLHLSDDSGTIPEQSLPPLYTQGSSGSRVGHFRG